MSLLAKMRDKAVETFIKNHPMVKRFGEIVNLAIDSSEGTADVVILLHGEKTPLTFRGTYSFESEKSDTEIVINKISCEREWIDEALSFWMSKQTLRYPLPGITGGLAKIFF